MRNPFSPRTSVLFALAVLLAAALPAPTTGQDLLPPGTDPTDPNQINDMRDIRIVGARAFTSGDAGWARLAAFPEPGSKVRFIVRLQVFESNAPQAAALDFRGDVSILGERWMPTSTPARWEVDEDGFSTYDGGCFGQQGSPQAITVPKVGRDFPLEYTVPDDVTGTITLRFTTNSEDEACDGFDTCCSGSETLDDSDNRRLLSLAIGRAPDFAVVKMVCKAVPGSSPDCFGKTGAVPDRTGGPGVTGPASSTVAGPSYYPFRVCYDWNDPNTDAVESQQRSGTDPEKTECEDESTRCTTPPCAIPECPTVADTLPGTVPRDADGDPVRAREPGDPHPTGCIVYFEVLVSALMRTDGWPATDTEVGTTTWYNTAALPTVDSNEDPHETSDPADPANVHLDERYLVYPHVDRQEQGEALETEPIVPIMIPAIFEICKVGPGGCQKLSSLLLSDTDATDTPDVRPIAPNCPDGVRRCVKWLSSKTGGAPGYTDLATTVRTSKFNLSGLAGDFQVWAYLNGVEPLNATTIGCGKYSSNLPAAPEKDCGNNKLAFPFHVSAPDLKVTITKPVGFRDPPDAYESDDTLAFTGTITNAGDAAIASSYAARFFIDDRVYQGTGITFDTGNLQPGQSRSFSVSLPMNGPDCADETCARFVAPGTRTARVVVDTRNVVLETDETNNEAQLPFLVEDTQAPTIGALRVFNARGVEVKGSPPEVNRGEALTLTTVVADTDHSVDDVQLELTRPSGQTYACADCTPFTQVSRTKNEMTFEADLPTGLPDAGEWTLTIRATDPSGQVATPSVQKVKVSAFKKQATFDYAPLPPPPATPAPPCLPPGSCPEPEQFPTNGTVLDYRGETGTPYAIKPAWTLPDDPREQHGFTPAWTSQGVRVRIESPDHNWTDYTVENDKVLVTKLHTGATEKRGDGNGNVAGPVNFTEITDWSPTTCTANTGCQRRSGDTGFTLPVSYAAKAIGKYNVTLNITDLGGSGKEYLTSFDIRDKVPFANMTLKQVTTGDDRNPDEGQDLKPGLSIRYRATGHDDLGFEPDGTIHLNFTHVLDDFTVDKWVNLSMGKPTSACAKVGNFFDCHFEKRVKTGRSIDGADLTLAGKWNITLWSEDKYHNFGKNTTTKVVPATATAAADPGQPLFAVLADAEAADFDGAAAYGTSHGEEEVGGTVVFYARVKDDLDPSVRLEVKDGATVLADFVEMSDPDRDGNYTYEMTFDAPHALEYRFKVVDSNTDRAPKLSETRTLTISENLAPRIDVLIPKVDGHGYFAKAAPTLEFKVYDTAQKVDPASIVLSVDDEAVVLSDAHKTTVDDGKTFVVRHVRDASRPWEHGQKVNFTIDAKDLSVPPKETRIEGNFTVDAVAPKSRIVSFEPRYVARQGDVWNVSLDTRFTAESNDSEDGLPTGVPPGGIKYVFFRGVSSNEFTYNGTPFPMSDRPTSLGVDSAEYSVYVLGTDVVGNKESRSVTNTVRVFLDKDAPRLVAAKLRESGSVVNATFEDPAAGVKSARIHYRHDAGAWATLDMTRRPDGTWTAAIPGGSQARIASYFLAATDNVGNFAQFGSEQAPLRSFPLGNHPPTVVITSPADGQTVGGSVTLTWEASDPDEGDTLTYRVYYKPAAGTSELELATLPAGTESYVLNTASFGPDGEYEISVTASDAYTFGKSSVRVGVANADAVIEGIVSEQAVVEPGEAQCIRARITKTNVALVEAVVILDGDEVETVALADNGRDCDVREGDGVYSGSVLLDETGSYDVEILARYIEAGESKESRLRQNGLFEVKLSAMGVVGRNPVLFGAFVALGAAVFAVGGFAVYRRWR